MRLKRKIFLFILLLASCFLFLASVSYYLLITNRSPFILKTAMATVNYLMKGQHIAYYKIDLTVFPEKGAIQAECDIKVNFLEGRRYLIFFLNDGLKIDSVKFKDGEAKAYRVWLINFLALPEKVKRGKNLVVKLTYEGGLRPLGFSDGYIKEKEFILRNEDLWYPMDFQGFFTFNISGTIPVSITPMLHGKVVITEDGKNKRFVWQSERPVQGFAIMGGYFNKLSKNADGINYHLYSPVYHREDMEKTIDNIILCHSFFKEQFGDDGFKNLTVAITPHAYRSYNHGSGIITLSKTDFPMIAHEIAHNWWGGIVYVNLLKFGGDGGQWITEGFAEFSSLIAVEKIQGKDAFLKELERESFNPYQQKAIDLISTFDNLMNQEEVAINHQMVYAKGAYVLIMLREVMGEEKFMQAIRDFFNGYRYRIASSRDFQNIAERVMGNSLSWFFDRWLRGTGRLDYAVTDLNFIEKDGSFITTVKVLNKGDIKIQDEVDVMAVTEGGEEFQRVIINEDYTTIVFETKSKVKKIILDPHIKWADMERGNNIGVLP